MNLIEELSWRGLVQDIMPGTEEKLSADKNVAGYIGFDPTADSLHIGHLIPILLLVHFQKAGHKPIALVGGATGMVGDPSGKNAERNLLDEETINRNLALVKKQLEQFLDFSSALPNGALIVNNYTWFKDLRFLDFIRDVGKYVTINYMMSKDSVRRRIESEQGISFTEFSYQLVQGYDFLWLYEHYNCVMQMGGSDQWGNITTGAELIRRKIGKECFAFTCPLITKADGSKFGKSADGNVWLDPQKTSPYHFYQFWMNASDEDAKDWIKKFTFLPKEEILLLTEQFAANPQERLLQKKLSEVLTIFIHGKEQYEKAVKISGLLFGSTEISALTGQISADEFTDAIKDFPAHTVSANTLFSAQPTLVDLLAEIGISPSKSEARKLIQSGGVSINKQKIKEPTYQIGKDSIIYDRYILINKGKKNYFIIRIAE